MTPSSFWLARVARRLTHRFANLSRTAVAFGIVGIGGMCIDLAVFNVLRLGLLGPSFSLMAKPLTASVISASFAIVFNWLGSRYWAFRDSRRDDALREFAEYGLVALLGLGIGLATLAFTHYTLGLTSLAADNFSKNVLGLALGTTARFLLLRFWVWGRTRTTPPTTAAASISSALTGAIPVLTAAVPVLTGAIPVIRREAA